MIGGYQPPSMRFVVPGTLRKRHTNVEGNKKRFLKKKHGARQVRIAMKLAKASETGNLNHKYLQKGPIHA